MSFYVCFNIDTGEIEKFTNSLVGTEEYLEISKDTYAPFVKGDIQMEDYIVIPTSNPLEKYQLVEKTKIGTESLSNDSIKPLKLSNSNEGLENVFYIIQEKNQWKGFASLSKEYKSYIKKSPAYQQMIKTVYVTSKHNPYKLIDVLEVPMAKFLTKRKFIVKKGMPETDVSLYTNSTHDKFIHSIEV